MAKQAHDPSHRHSEINGRPYYAHGEQYRQIAQTAFLVVSDFSLSIQTGAAKDMHTGHGAVLGTADVGDSVQRQRECAR